MFLCFPKYLVDGFLSNKITPVLKTMGIGAPYISVEALKWGLSKVYD